LLERLLPAVRVWTVSAPAREPAQEPVERVEGVVSLGTGSEPVLEAPAREAEPSKRRPGRPKLSAEEKRARQNARTREWRARRKAEATWGCQDAARAGAGARAPPERIGRADLFSLPGAGRRGWDALRRSRVRGFAEKVAPAHH
jgi:hypothetical protein